ncbi:bifunctional preprotein translocase subunit SecD/SecF [Lacunisphaera limnophila]|uniref:Multifunctional fusion protein n=1 Tax=Lacunisphaera limnophila TaxID=1838286 RepID=A0A1D8AXI3_9BACT|nr:protein translocase subunit SecDF [Lacunisphaera limnophila]AOS45596.1 bifunctional preprotein translocase subunit SecD/SecF [Lacunisphaera limnophila]
MFRQNLWKLTLCAIIVLWAAFNLIPLKDQPFGDYVKAEAEAKPTQFTTLMTRVAERVKSGQASSTFVALKQIGREDKIDLSEFFPQIRLEESLKNVEKRNELLLNELLRRSKGRLQLGLDLKGGVAFTLEVDETLAVEEPDYARTEKLNKAIEIIGNRVNGLGVSEPIIRAVGTNRIEVQLAGVTTTDNPEVLSSLRKPARLDFRMVHPFAAPPMEAPPGFTAMTLEQETRTGETFAEELYVKRIPEMTGEAVSDSYPIMDEFGRFKIILRFTAEGSTQFAQVTKAIADEGQRTGRRGRLAIVLDDKLYSAPGVEKEINSDSAEISGQFSQREAVDLANVLNNPLDIPLVVKEQYEVGPSLAQDAIASGKLAFIIGTSLTVGFILLFYTYGGIVAAVGMGINVLIVLGVMASIGATLTLPGIAGIVLTLAMSVDSNILIFERMREELKQGKSLATALEAGFDKAWSAIIDGNLTTLITAAIMIVLGTGAVKGFGVTLTIGIFTTMFAAVVVSKLMLEFLVHGNVIKKLPMFSVLQNTNYDFLKKAKIAFIGSWLLIAVGVITVAVKGKDVYGIDFLGGDTVALSFAKPVEVGALRAAAQAAGFKEVNPVYQKPIGSDRTLLKITTPFDQAAPLVEKLQQAFPESQFKNEGVTRIGASVGEEIQWNALKAVFWALVLILIYVAFRFEFGYGMGAVVSTIHDVVMTIGVFVLFDRQFNASMVAAILLVMGYSINDTIVVFDRIREELKLNPTGTLREIINRSLNLTLSRTIITGGTTLLTALTLIFVTSGDVNDIALTLLIGVVTGTFSSLFIASPIFYWWHKGDRKHVEAHHDIAPKYDWAGSSRASE